MRDGIVPVMEVNGNSGNGFGGFGDNGWWIIIVLLLFGWGRGYGYGGNDGGSNTVPFYQSLDTDFATIERKIDGVYSGICDSTYALNNGIQNGFAAAQNTMTQGFAGLNTGMVQQGYENRIAISGVNNELFKCCCDLKSIAQDNKYENLQNLNILNNNVNNGFTNVQQAMCINTRDVIDNQNKNARDIIDLLNSNKLEAKNERIAELNNQVSALQLAASQAAQNEYLLNSLRNGCPVNAQLVCGNTPIPVQYITAGCGCGNAYNNGCGC